MKGGEAFVVLLFELGTNLLCYFSTKCVKIWFSLNFYCFTPNILKSKVSSSFHLIKELLLRTPLTTPMEQGLTYLPSLTVRGYRSLTTSWDWRRLFLIANFLIS